MDRGNLTVGLAFLAGLASFLSPCVLGLVPAYLGYLGGRSVSSTGETLRNRWMTFSHGLAFVVGFSLVFVALGVTASAIGGALYNAKGWLARIGGVIVIIFGLQTMGAIHIPLLNYDTRRQVQPNPRLGYLASGLMGVFFSAGWSPCVGPVLGAVLTLALDSAKISGGVILLSAYSAGMAVPFLLAALGMGRLMEVLRRHARAIKTISLITGAVLVALGVMLLTGTLEHLARFGFFVDFGL